MQPNNGDRRTDGGGGFSLGASGWSGCRVGLAPTGKRRLSTAHVKNRPAASRPYVFFRQVRTSSRPDNSSHIAAPAKALAAPLTRFCGPSELQLPFLDLAFLAAGKLVEYSAQVPPDLPK
jgi:hypothetical protein